MYQQDRRDNVPLECKVYVGNLGSGASRNELEKEFKYFGRLVNVWVARNPPGFAYVEYEHPEDAKDAVQEMDGKLLCGKRIRCEMSHGKSRRRDSWGQPQRDSFSRRGSSDDRCYSCGGRDHWARDCPGGRPRSRSPRKRRFSRSRSRDNSRSRSPIRKRSASPRRRQGTPELKSIGRNRPRSRSISRSRSRSRSISRSRSRS